MIRFNAGCNPDRPETGYIIREGERGQGYATEAASIAVDSLFLSRNIERVQAHTLPENVPSQKVLEKVGFKKEGELRHVAWIRGYWLNHYAWSILREEWGSPRILKAAQAIASPEELRYETPTGLSSRIPEPMRHGIR